MPWGSCPCPGVEMRGSPPLAPPLCVCGEIYLTLPSVVPCVCISPPVHTCVHASAWPHHPHPPSSRDGVWWVGVGNKKAGAPRAPTEPPTAHRRDSTHDRPLHSGAAPQRRRPGIIDFPDEEENPPPRGSDHPRRRARSTYGPIGDAPPPTPPPPAGAAALLFFARSRACRWPLRAGCLRAAARHPARARARSAPMPAELLKGGGAPLPLLLRSCSASCSALNLLFSPSPSLEKRIPISRILAAFRWCSCGAVATCGD